MIRCCTYFIALIMLEGANGSAWDEEKITAGAAYAYMPVFRELTEMKGSDDDAEY